MNFVRQLKKAVHLDPVTKHVQSIMSPMAEGFLNQNVSLTEDEYKNAFSMRSTIILQYKPNSKIEKSIGLRKTKFLMNDYRHGPLIKSTLY